MESATMAVKRIFTIGQATASASSSFRVMSERISKIFLIMEQATAATTNFSANTTITITMRGGRRDKVVANAIPVGLLKKVANLRFGSAVYESHQTTGTTDKWKIVAALDLGYYKLTGQEYFDITIVNGDALAVDVVGVLGKQKHMPKLYDLQYNTTIQVPNVRSAFLYTALGTNLIESTIAVTKKVFRKGGSSEESNTLGVIAAATLSMMELEGVIAYADGDIVPIYHSEGFGGSSDLTLNLSSSMYCLSISDFVHEPSILDIFKAKAARAGRRLDRIGKYIPIGKISQAVRATHIKAIGSANNPRDLAAHLGELDGDDD